MSNRTVESITIKKSPVKVTSMSIEINVLGHLDKISREMGYTKSSLTTKIVKEWIEARMLNETNRVIEK